MMALADLPERPPTPPQQATTCALGHESRLNNGAVGFSSLLTGLTVATPPTSSPPAAADSSQRTGNKRKRVEWSPWTEYRRSAGFAAAGTAGDDLEIKPIPSSRERKPSKSILKPYDQYPSTTPSGSSSPGGPEQRSPPNQNDLATMLESVVQQLAGEARTTRLDAYLTLNRTLKHYGDFPDPTAMVGKMGLFMQFIQRDISARIAPSGALDSSLITQALKLLIILSWTPRLSSHLTDEFCTTVIEHAITVLASPQQPKAIVIHYMHLLSVQAFPKKVMTAERADQIVSALEGISDSVKGSAVLCERLSIYHRMIRQSQQVMASRARDWIDHLFAGMLSHDKEVRTRAITYGMAAGLALGTMGQVSRIVKDTFSRTINAEEFASYIQERLTKSIATKDFGPDVPKIWTVVILFLRSRSHRIETWEHLNSWLRIIQKCFNSSDPAVKAQTNLAWNRMIFAIDPTESLSPRMIKMLHRPIVGQLDKNTPDKNLTAESRDLALASLCCLLYYSFRPSAKFSQLDIYWEEYVGQVVVGFVIQNTHQVQYGVRLLAALFDGAQDKPWRAYRAVEGQSILPKELPRIDPKWSRSRSRLVLGICDSVFARATWPRDLTEKAPVIQFWRNLMKTIADAGTMEVKLATELMEAIAHIFNFFQSIWNRGPVALAARGDDAADVFINRFGFLVTTTLDSLGPLVFTENLLVRKAERDFEAIGTPSRRATKHHNVTGQSPLAYLFQLLVQPFHGYESTPAYHALARTVAETCYKSRTSRASQMELLTDCASFLDVTALPGDAAKRARRDLWQVVVEAATTVLSRSGRDDTAHSENLGSECQETVDLADKLLSGGLDFDDAKSLGLWQELLMSATTSLAAQAKGKAMIMTLIEPIARKLCLSSDQADTSIELSRAACLIESAPLPGRTLISDYFKGRSGTQTAGPEETVPSAEPDVRLPSTRATTEQVSTPRKRREPSTTTAKSPVKRRRQNSSANEALVEDILDYIIIQHSPTSRETRSPQSSHVASSPLKPRSQPDSVCAAAGPGNLESSARLEVHNSRNLDCEGASVPAAVMHGNAGDKESAPDSGKMSMVSGPQAISSNLDADSSRVKRRRLGSRRGSLSTSAEAQFETARTNRSDDHDDHDDHDADDVVMRTDRETDDEDIPRTLAVSGRVARGPHGLHAGLRRLDTPAGHPGPGTGERERSATDRTPHDDGMPESPPARADDAVRHVPPTSPRSPLDQDPHGAVTPPGTATEAREDVLTGPPERRRRPSRPAVAGIIGGLKRILSDLRRAVLGPQDVRQIDDLLFDAKRETFAAERRSGDGSASGSGHGDSSASP